jgi:hypothetical protein
VQTVQDLFAGKKIGLPQKRRQEWLRMPLV